MWVDGSAEPAVVYLAGTLTDETGANVASVVRGLVGEGHHDLVVDAGRLSLDHGWFDVLCGVQDEARRAGGSVTWSFAPDSHPGPLVSTSRAGLRRGRHGSLSPAGHRG